MAKQTIKTSTYLYNIHRIIFVKLFLMVPGAGLEPAQIFIRGILSPLRLPIPPSRHTHFFMEAAPGFEPGIGVLQTPALPLGYTAMYFYFNIS